MTTALLLAAALWAQSAEGAPPQPVAAPQPAPAAAETPAPTERLMVLPVRVAADAPAQLKRTSEALERVLTEALSRNAPQKVISRQEVALMLTEGMRQQLNGCDAESCMAEAADAMGAQLAVTSTLSQREDTWIFQASLVRRQDASAVRRASVRTRSVEALLNSMEPLSRQLTGGEAVAVEDPRLAQRLSTTTPGTAQLKAAVAAGKNQDLSATWTRLLVEKNAESNALTLLQAAIPLGAAVLAVVLSTTLGIGLGLEMNTWSGDYRQPLPMLLLGASVAGLLFLLAGTVTASIVLAVVDMRNIGRIPVGPDGCCRDEDALVEAEGPSLVQRAAPIVAAVATLLALAGPLCLAAGWAGGLIVPAVVRPNTSFVTNNSTSALFLLLVYGSAAMAFTGLLVPLGVAITGLVTTVALLASDSTPLTDEKAPPGPQPAGATARQTPPQK